MTEWLVMTWLPSAAGLLLAHSGWYDESFANWVAELSSHIKVVITSYCEEEAVCPVQLRFVNIHKCMCPGAQTQLIILAQPAGGQSSSLGWRMQLIPLDLHRLVFQIYACLKKGSPLCRNIIGFRSLINHRSCKNTASGSLLLAASPCGDCLRITCWEQHP